MMISVLLGIFDTCMLRRVAKIETLMVDCFGVCLACHIVETVTLYQLQKLLQICFPFSLKVIGNWCCWSFQVRVLFINVYYYAIKLICLIRFPCSWVQTLLAHLFGAQLILMRCVENFARFSSSSSQFRIGWT